ncbi:MAG: class II aldolase/adducin family protein [Desulfovibrio sp.]|jgi:thiamine-monophosphate kinase|nr:class II aldolase/adducin family protein [Desulfovibrio sp.]
MDADTPAGPEICCVGGVQEFFRASRRSSASCSSLWQEKANGSKAPTSEADCLALIDELFPDRSAHVPYGRGDDCALLVKLPPGMALSTDMFWEDVHFRTSYFTPEETGGKALSSAVSDLAAAGAVPLAFSLALMLPVRLGGDALRAVLSGMADKAREYGIVLSGGDLSRGEKLGFSVTVWGKNPFPGAAALRRGKARPGDVLFLVGEAGLAGAGFRALERFGRSALERCPKACLAHISPRPLLAEGQAIARLVRNARGHGHRLSLMDLSDGLARDLPRLLGGLGSDLFLSEGGISPEAAAAACIVGESPEAVFLTGGEDYSLIGSCAESFWARLADAVPGIRLLGRAGADAGLRLNGRPVALEGFDHFADCSKDLSWRDAAREAGRTPANNGQEEAVAARPCRAGITIKRPEMFAEEKKALIRLGLDAWTVGMMAGFNGNVSYRVSLDAHGFPLLYDHMGTHDSPETPACREACLITRSGAAKGRLTEDDFSLLDLGSGRHLAGPPASTESALHLAVYAACPQSRVVLHVHPPCLLALSLMLESEKRLILPLPEANVYRACLGHVPFQPPGSAELAKVTAEAARTHAAVWMERHGLVVHGVVPHSTLALAEELEQLGKVHLALLHCLCPPDGKRHGSSPQSYDK